MRFSRFNRGLALILLFFAVFIANHAFGQFPRVSGLVELRWNQDGTDQCLTLTAGGDVTLERCGAIDEPSHIWVYRADFTLHNPEADVCLYRFSPRHLATARCDGNDPNQKWWIGYDAQALAYKISRFDDRNRCLGVPKGGPGLRITRCAGERAVAFDFSVPDPPDLLTGNIPPQDTGTLRNIREIVPEGFKFSPRGNTNLHNKYVWSLVQYKNAVLVGTLNAATKKDVYEFTEGVAINSDGAQVWKGTTPDGGKTWKWKPLFNNGLFDKDNFGVRKMITCGDNDRYILAVYMNNKDGFGLLRYDGKKWTKEFTDGGPTTSQSSGSLQDPHNVSGRGMAVFRDYVYLGIVNTQTAAKMWRRKINPDCTWAEGFEWEVVTGNGFALRTNPDPEDKNDWFGDMEVFGPHVYAGTLNETGGQIWRSLTGKPGRRNWEKVYDAKALGPSRDVNMIKLFSFDDGLVAGTENQQDGAEMLVSQTGDEGTWQRIFERGMNGDPRNTYVWFVTEAFGRMYTFWGSDFPGYHAFSMADLAGVSYDTESTNAFNAPPLYYGGRTAIQFSPGNGYDPLLLMGTATPDNDRGLRLYAAEYNPDNVGHVFATAALPGRNGPTRCLRTLRAETGTLLNNGQSWVNWRETGELAVRGPSGRKWVTPTDGSTSAVAKLCFNKNGNLVIYHKGQKVWQSGSFGGERMKLRADCNLVIAGSNGVIWSSGTTCD